MITIEKVNHAFQILSPVVRRTDLIEATRLASRGTIYIKTENLQRTGSFKLRGAYYKISQLSDSEKKSGIIACSAGNHAQGVAFAANKMGIDCVICMPDGAPISKVEATKSYGAKVVLVPGTYDDASIYAKKLQQESGATLIHPFDDIEVISGQGTIALEILEQLENIDAIVVPIGGGGLIAGLAYTIKNLKPNILVYGVQAEHAPSMYHSWLKGVATTVDTIQTFADGIAVKTPGINTFELIKKYVDKIVTVTEDEIATAVLALMEKQKIISEGAGATAVASVLFDKLPIQGKKVVCVVSGGNIDVNILSRVITRGLVTSGRKATFQIALEDKPGQLVKVSKIIKDCGANIVSVDYSGSDPNMAITSCFLTIGMETRGFDQISEIEQALRKAGLVAVHMVQQSHK